MARSHSPVSYNCVSLNIICALISLSLLFWHCLNDTSKWREPIRIGRVVVVGIAVGIHITEVIAVVAIRRSLPPVDGIKYSFVQNVTVFILIKI